MDIKLIDEFRRRTNASYEEARYYLERCNGDLIEAIVAFEKERAGAGFQKNRNFHGRANRLLNGLLRVVQKLIDIKIIIIDRTGKDFRIPLLLLLVLGPIWHILLLVAIVMLIMGFKFLIREISDPNVNVYDFVEKIKSKVRENH
ncbi:MAG TPA: hypothetical protein GXZ22_02695 [Clostridiaceae bacterium]|nr:hypothetical protein [Clostridiaceae bacterium]